MVHCIAWARGSTTPLSLCARHGSGARSSRSGRGRSSRSSSGRACRPVSNGEEFRLTYELAARYGRADKQAYEPDIYRAFVDRIRPGMTVLDIGAHVGFFALGAAKRVRPQGRVYAFEPAPENASILERHISFNGFIDRVEIVRKVVSDINGVVPFYTNGETMAASILRENLERWSLQHFDSPTVELEAPSVSLDRFCADANIKPDVIKMDVEGAELQVLRGARQVMSDHPMSIICEVHPVQMESCGGSVSEFEALIESVGYRLQPLDQPAEMGRFHCLIEMK